MDEIKTLGKKEFLNDKKLDKILVDVQEQLGSLRSVLSDYIYMDSPSNSHICLVKRSKKVFFNVLLKRINILEETIGEISKLLCSKVYSDKHLASKVFEIKILNIDYYKCNTQVLLGSFKRLKKKIFMNKDVRLYKRNELLVGECIYLYEMTFDVSKFFDDMYGWKRLRYEELVNKNMLEPEKILFTCQNRQRAFMRKTLSARDVLGASQQIICRYMYRDDISVVPVAIFQLRQAIEIRVLEILGIYGIQKDDGTPEKITANSFFEMPDLQKYIIFPVDIVNLKKIYTWSNSYVHMGLRGDYWLLEFAQNYLLDFILENAVILKAYYDLLPKKISEFTRCDINKIVHRQNCWVEIIEDEEEFDRIKKLIDDKGYSAYKKEKDERIIKCLKKNN